MKTLSEKVMLGLLSISVLGGGMLATEGVEAADPAAKQSRTTFMFVQNASSGSLVKVEGKKGVYTLKLQGVAPQTIAFSDRPERIVEQAPMQKFLDGMCFKAKNPPNGAISILEGADEAETMVVDLTLPVYDAQKGELQYTVHFLEKPDHSLAIYNERHDQSLPESFGAVALFLDDCPDTDVMCCTGPGETDCKGSVTTGCCWNGWHLACEECDKDRADAECVAKYGSKYGDSANAECLW